MASPMTAVIWLGVGVTSYGMMQAYISVNERDSMCESLTNAFSAWEQKLKDELNNEVPVSAAIELYHDGSGKLINKMNKETIYTFDELSELIEFFRKD